MSGRNSSRVGKKVKTWKSIQNSKLFFFFCHFQDEEVLIQKMCGCQLILLTTLSDPVRLFLTGLGRSSKKTSHLSAFCICTLNCRTHVSFKVNPE